MREREIEKHFVRSVRQRGGLCYKFVSPGNAGVPDRIVVTPAGRVYFIELKNEVGRLSAAQKWRQGELRNCSAEVRTLRSIEQVQEFVEEVMPREVQSTPVPTVRHRPHRRGAGAGAVSRYGLRQDGGGVDSGA